MHATYCFINLHTDQGYGGSGAYPGNTLGVRQEYTMVGTPVHSRASCTHLFIARDNVSCGHVDVGRTCTDSSPGSNRGHNDTTTITTQL